MGSTFVTLFKLYHSSLAISSNAVTLEGLMFQFKNFRATHPIHSTHLSGNIQYCQFWDWLISFSIIQNLTFDEVKSKVCISHPNKMSRWQKTGGQWSLECFLCLCKVSDLTLSLISKQSPFPSALSSRCVEEGIFTVKFKSSFFLIPALGLNNWDY